VETISFEEAAAKALKLLERNHVSAADIARYTKADVHRARRLIDKISIEYPLYEVRRGIYGLLPREEDRRPRGLIARALARERLSPKH
jgi:hypothetical protein